MKKLTKILSVLFLSMFLVAGSAMALPTSLFEITNIAGTEGYTDTGVEAVVLNHTGSSDAPDATAFLIFEFAGWKANNSFGIYDYTVETDGSITAGNILEVFDGSDSPLSSVTLQWGPSLTTVTNAFTKESAIIDDTFGFYMKNTVNNDGAGVLWYSHSSLNDGEDHVMLFDTER